MRTVLTCLSSLLLFLPAAARAERRPTPREARTDKPQPRPAATPADGAEREAPRPPEERGPNEERDPEKRRRFEQRRADTIEKRQLGRTLLDIGRQTKNPLTLLTAAQLLQRLPPARPLSTVATGGDDGPLIPSRDATTRTTTLLQAADVLAEARALARSQAGPQQREELALLDRAAATEVTARGAALGPQSTCEGIGPASKLTYHVAYDGGERAAIAISGSGPGDLFVSISDEEGNLVSRTYDRSLVSWYPRWRGVFRVDIENRSPHRVEFCLETN